MGHDIDRCITTVYSRHEHIVQEYYNFAFFIVIKLAMKINYSYTYPQAIFFCYS